MNGLMGYLAGMSGATWLGIAALVLMYPVAFVANVTTPILRDWWSTRSRRSMEKRLRNLVEIQDKLSKEPVDRNTLLILNAILYLIVFITGASGLIFVMVGTVLDQVAKGKVSAAGAVDLFMLIDVGLAIFCVLKIGVSLGKVSQNYRDELRNRINRLQGKIDRQKYFK
jgi:hypothetical protein